MRQLKRNTKGVGAVIDWLVSEYAKGEIHNIVIGIEYKNGFISSVHGGSKLILKQLGLAKYVEATLANELIDNDE